MVEHPVAARVLEHDVGETFQHAVQLRAPAKPAVSRPPSRCVAHSAIHRAACSGVRSAARIPFRAAALRCGSTRVRLAAAAWWQISRSHASVHRPARLPQPARSHAAQSAAAGEILLLDDGRSPPAPAIPAARAGSCPATEPRGKRCQGASLDPRRRRDGWLAGPFVSSFSSLPRRAATGAGSAAHAGADHGGQPGAPRQRTEKLPMDQSPLEARIVDCGASRSNGGRCSIAAQPRDLLRAHLQHAGTSAIASAATWHANSSMRSMHLLRQHRSGEPPVST
jgi:hypothetical protein